MLTIDIRFAESFLHELEKKNDNVYDEAYEVSERNRC